MKYKVEMIVECLEDAPMERKDVVGAVREWMRFNTDLEDGFGSPDFKKVTNIRATKIKED